METLYERASREAANANLGELATMRLVGMDVQDPLSVYYGHPKAQIAMMLGDAAITSEHE